MSKVQFLKPIAILAVLACSLSAHALIRKTTTGTPIVAVPAVVAPPNIRPIAQPPAVVLPGTYVPPTTPVVSFNTCTSGQASRC
jgi:hypothetical protein